jgi:hypothetical protein
MGYDDESKAIRIYWPDSRSIGIECDVLFSKHSPNLSEEIVIESSPPQAQQMPEVTCVTTAVPTTTTPPQPAPTSPPKADPKMTHLHSQLEDQLKLPASHWDTTNNLMKEKTQLGYSR